jgi:hypothetical protein
MNETTTNERFGGSFESFVLALWFFPQKEASVFRKSSMAVFHPNKDDFCATTSSRTLRRRRINRVSSLLQKSKQQKAIINTNTILFTSQ